MSNFSLTYQNKVISEIIAKYLNKGNIVIYESTVYPGIVSEDFCVPILEKLKKQYNNDFFCGCSPERISLETTVY